MGNEISKQLPDVLNPKKDIFQDLNNLIAQGNTIVACGPECQKEKLDDEYYQAYIKAQKTLDTAPKDLDVAYKNYIVHTKGQAVYDQIVKDSLTSQAAGIATDLSSNFFNGMSDAVALNDAYRATVINYNNSDELYNNYESTNSSLQNQIDNATNDIYTNDRKSYYNNQEIGGLMIWRIWLRWIYIILLISFVLCMFFVKSELKVRMQIYILIALFIYPFIAKPIILYLVRTLQWFGSLIPKNVYLNEAPSRDPNSQRDNVDMAIPFARRMQLSP
jgi:hypothetical protein